jgi:hypothetical protein
MGIMLMMAPPVPTQRNLFKQAANDDGTHCRRSLPSMGGGGGEPFLLHLLPEIETP